MSLKRSNILLIVGGILLWLLIGTLLKTYVNSHPINYCTDDEIVGLNMIIKEVGNHSDNLQELNTMTFAFPFTVLDSEENLVYSYGQVKRDSIAEGIRHGDMVLKSEYTLLISFDRESRIRSAIAKTVRFLWMITGIVVLLLVTVLLYIQNRILGPFHEMEDFAGAIAAGNLDVPLTMGKRRYFGAYTESFDLMREELKKAKEQEYQANVSKKELVVTLSHDIKTPVTSIKLMCELMAAKMDCNEIEEKEFRTKLDSIYAKTEQIDTLVSDMFQSTLEDLGELRIAISEEPSNCLKEMLTRADFRGKIHTQEDPPPCLLVADLLRLEQVIGNVINNSYKYADTGIEIDYSLEDGYLALFIRDFGEGVSEEELPHIFQKFYRGKNALKVQKSGAGLGLYICGSLMEKMGGSISAENREPGFCICIRIALV